MVLKNLIISNDSSTLKKKILALQIVHEKNLKTCVVLRNETGDNSGRTVFFLTQFVCCCCFSHEDACVSRRCIIYISHNNLSRAQSIAEEKETKDKENSVYIIDCCLIHKMAGALNESSPYYSCMCIERNNTTTCQHRTGLLEFKLIRVYVLCLILTCAAAWRSSSIKYRVSIQ